jgi:predicted DNA-binding protein with PD1-like motif
MISYSFLKDFDSALNNFADKKSFQGLALGRMRSFQLNFLDINNNTLDKTSLYK